MTVFSLTLLQTKQNLVARIKYWWNLSATAIPKNLMSNFSFRWNSTVYASFHIHFLFGLFAKVFSYAHTSNAHVSASSVVAKFIEVVLNFCQVCNLKSSLVFVVGKISAYNERLSCKWYYLSFLEILSWRIPSNDERLPLTRETRFFAKCVTVFSLVASISREGFHQMHG